MPRRHCVGGRMPFRDALFALKDIYNLPASDDLFLKAVCEVIDFHRKSCGEYERILKTQGYLPPESLGDLYKIPVLPTMFLKEHTLFSVPEKKLLIKGTTSGTSGKQSLVGMDFHTAVLALKMVMATFSYHHLFSPCPTNYIVLGYQPSKHNTMGIAKSAYAMTFAAPAASRVYALKDTGEDYEINLEEVLTSLMRYAKAQRPVRIIGLPAYFLFMLKAMEEAGIAVKLNGKSKVILAGGWKSFWRQKADKQILYDKSKELLGISQSGFYDIYGPVEHPVTYCACRNHNFHVPVYSRVIVRDVETLKPLPIGEMGLVNLISPLMGSMPVTSIMTDDLAVLHKGDECGCGIKSPYFELKGRAGAPVRTCAVKANEYLD